jgi:hypothetical protein
MKSRKCQLLIAISALLLSSLAQAACNAGIAADAPDARFSTSGDVVTDSATGLAWKRCSEGLSGASCSGTATLATWQEALAAGSGEWRLPNRNELASLLERQCSNPAINAAVFPGTPASSFWSSSPFGLDAAFGWLVDFNVGDVGPAPKSGKRNVRLVRATN